MKKISLIIIPFLIISVLMCFNVSAYTVAQDIEKTYEIETETLRAGLPHHNVGYILTDYNSQIEIELEVKNKINYPKGYNYYSIIKGIKNYGIVYTKDKITYSYFNDESLKPNIKNEILVIPFTTLEKAENFLKSHYTKTKAYPETTLANEYTTLIYELKYQETIYSTNELIDRETTTLKDFRDTREKITIGEMTASQIQKKLMSEILAVIPVVFVVILGYAAIRKGIGFTFGLIKGA